MWRRRVATDPVTVATIAKSFSGLAASIWKNGALLLWSLATSCVAILLALVGAAKLGLGDAPAMLTAFGTYLALACIAFGVFASFKSYAEREKPALSIIPNERQSFWHHAVQPDGRTMTQIQLRFQVTNQSKSAVKLSAVRLLHPKLVMNRSSLICC
jgi:hypothetical protein